ncbi:MAG: nucleotidyltransferase family protein [Oscillospiraceae bacterium]|nr:nucleotidyltransferase family protein [Oscillospiraceae bacterium]
MKSDISGILLAAGLSRRMGADKLLLEYAGQTLLARAVALLGSLPCREKILVTTAGRLSAIDLPAGIRAIVNPNPGIGQSESLRLGLAAAARRNYLFLNADQPRLYPDALAPLFTLAGENPEKIVFPTVNGQPCPPVLFPAVFREDLLAQTGDAGGRAVRTANPELCLTFEVGNPEDFLDVDTPQDYRRMSVTSDIF